MERLLYLMTGLSLALIALVLVSVRRAHIRVEYSMSWLLAGVVLLALSCWRALLDRFARLVGVPDSALALLVAVVVVFSLVVFRLSIILSKLKDANIALTQRVAILEFRISSLDETPEAQSAR